MFASKKDINYLEKELHELFKKINNMDDKLYILAKHFHLRINRESWTITKIKKMEEF